MASTTWRKDRITDREDPETGLRIVELPTVKGMTKGERDALFAFEREHLGTTRAVIRINKRHAGETDLPVPYRLTKAGIPAALSKFYGATDSEAAEA